MTTGLALILGLSVAFAACRRSPPPQVEASPDAEEIIVPVAGEPAQVGTLRAVFRASGVVVAGEGGEFLVVAPEPARIIEITKKAGDMVAAGDLLVRFELPAATQELARQRAELASAQALLENARATQARVRDFVDRGMVPRRDLDTAEREMSEAQTAVARADVARVAAESALGRASSRAPFSGLVVARLHEPGDLVQRAATDAVLRLIDPRRLEVVATVAAADMSHIQPGASAHLAGGLDGRPVALTVASDPAPAAGEGYRRVRLTFGEPVAIPVDSPVQIDVDAEARVGVVFVPPSAIVRDAAGDAVFVANGSVAERRPVTTGVSEDERVEIVSGLRAGEIVIARGQGQLKDGAAISIDLGVR